MTTKEEAEKQIRDEKDYKKKVIQVLDEFKENENMTDKEFVDKILAIPGKWTFKK